MSSHKKDKRKIIVLNGNTIELKGRCLYFGCNSVVYKCRYQRKNYIIKFFRGKKKVRYKRFRSEVEKIKKLNDEINNYTPKVIDSYFPKPQNYSRFIANKSPFYIMEEGEEYQYSKLTFEQKINDIIEMCMRLRQMNALGISHRDIKPENIIKYKGKLTYIDYGTAFVPNTETYDDTECMGSKGTMAPEMINHACDIPGYDYKYADIYSLGKTIWIILTNNPYAHIFTTYESTNIISKIDLEGIQDGIVMLIEYILNRATQENYFKRIELDKIIELFTIIRSDLMGNVEKCNEIKFECLLEKYYIPQYDEMQIKEIDKSMNFIEKISEVGVVLSLRAGVIQLCDDFNIASFSIKHENRKIFYFVHNNIKFIFKVEKIAILQKEIIIKTKPIEEQLDDGKVQCFMSLDSFSMKSLLINPIVGNVNMIYLDCDICLKSVSNIL